MNYVEASHRYIPLIASVTALLVLTCLGLSVIRQTKMEAVNLAGRANIAVFLSSDAVVDAAASRMMATGRVARTDFFSTDVVYEKMAASDSPLKDMLVHGENPFTPYCLVYPKNPSPMNARILAGEAMSVEGVVDAGYDEALFAAVERQLAVRQFYQMSLLLIFVVLSLVGGFRLVNNATARGYDYRALGVMVLCGSFSALLAAGAYVLLVHYAAAESFASLPTKYLLTMAPGGILLSVVLGLKR